MVKDQTLYQVVHMLQEIQSRPVTPKVVRIAIDDVINEIVKFNSTPDKPRLLTPNEYNKEMIINMMLNQSKFKVGQVVKDIHDDAELGTIKAVYFTHYGALQFSYRIDSGEKEYYEYYEEDLELVGEQA